MRGRSGAGDQSFQSAQAGRHDWYPERIHKPIRLTDVPIKLETYHCSVSGQQFRRTLMTPVSRKSRIVNCVDCCMLIEKLGELLGRPALLPHSNR